jgi:hypothetical protein
MKLPKNLELTSVSGRSNVEIDDLRTINYDEGIRTAEIPYDKWLRVTSWPEITLSTPRTLVSGFPKLEHLCHYMLPPESASFICLVLH